MASDAEIDELINEELAEELADSDNSDIEIVEIHDSAEPPDQRVTETPAPRPENEGTGIKNLRCPICLETPEIIAVASCGHPYCHECIFAALSSGRRANRREGECSLCRKRVRYDQVIYMEMKKGPEPSEPRTPPSEFVPLGRAVGPRGPDTSGSSSSDSNTGGQPPLRAS